MYIVLHDFYREILDHALTRPLDYDYLKELPPAAQRLYEVVSYAMFAALKNDRPRARLAYSEFCRLAPLTRYFEWEHARKQMAKIHTPHRQAGYFAGVEFEATTDREGRPDWTMMYKPGPKAKAEHLAFTTRGGPMVPALEPRPAPPEPLLLAEAQPTAVEPEPMGLAAELVERGVTRARGRRAGAGVPGGAHPATDRGPGLAAGDEAEAGQGRRGVSRQGHPGGFRDPRRVRGPGGRAARETAARAAHRAGGRGPEVEGPRAGGREAGPGVLGGVAPGAAGGARRRGAGRVPTPPPARRTRRRRRRRSGGCSRPAYATPTSDACWACPQRTDRRGPPGIALVAPPRRPGDRDEDSPRRGHGGPPRGQTGAWSRGADTPPRGNAPGVAAADGPRGRVTAPRGAGAAPVILTEQSCHEEPLETRRENYSANPEVFESPSRFADPEDAIPSRSPRRLTHSARTTG